MGLGKQGSLLPTLLKASVSFASSPPCHPFKNLDVHMMLACITSEAWGKVIATKKIADKPCSPPIACVLTRELCEARRHTFFSNRRRPPIWSVYGDVPNGG